MCMDVPKLATYPDIIYEMTGRIYTITSLSFAVSSEAIFPININWLQFN